MKGVKGVKGVKGAPGGEDGGATPGSRGSGIGRVVGREGSEVGQGGCMRWKQRPH